MLFRDAPLYRDWLRAPFEAVVAAFALAVAVPFVAAGLPAPTLDTTQVAALLVVAGLINVVTGRSMRTALPADSLADARFAVTLAVRALKAMATGQVCSGRLGTDYVGEPFDPEVLLTRIHACCGAKREARRGHDENARGDVVDIPPVRIENRRTSRMNRRSGQAGDAGKCRSAVARRALSFATPGAAARFPGAVVTARRWPTRTRMTAARCRCAGEWIR